MDWLVRALRAEPYWPPEGIEGGATERILATADAHNVTELLFSKLRPGAVWDEVPDALRQQLYRTRMRGAAREIFLQEEIAKDLTALGAQGIECLLLKGTSLANTLYPAPEYRPRCDVDLLIRDKETAETAWPVLRGLGYRRPTTISGDLVSHQYGCSRRVTELAGVVLDVHWRLSNSNFFAQKFCFEELWSERLPVPPLGPDAYALSLRHALVHALFHRVWHLGCGESERLIWLYDIDLICRHLDQAQWDGFADLVASRDLGPICRDGLERAAELYGTPIPEDLRHRIAPEHPRDSRQLEIKRPGYRRALVEIQSLGSWALRLRYLRENIIPDRHYMEQRFGAKGYPALTRAYLQRFWVGVGKRLRKWRGNSENSRKGVGRK